MNSWFWVCTPIISELGRWKKEKLILCPTWATQLDFVSETKPNQTKIKQNNKMCTKLRTDFSPRTDGFYVGMILDNFTLTFTAFRIFLCERKIHLPCTLPNMCWARHFLLETLEKTSNHCVWVWVCVCVCVGTYGNQTSMMETLELEVQAIVSGWMWVWGTKLKSSLLIRVNPSQVSGNGFWRQDSSTKQAYILVFSDYLVFVVQIMILKSQFSCSQTDVKKAFSLKRQILLLKYIIFFDIA